jgi:hypothetical protein
MAFSPISALHKKMVEEKSCDFETKTTDNVQLSVTFDPMPLSECFNVENIVGNCS